MEKATTSLIVALAIGALLGFGGGYYYMQPQVQSAYQQGITYQQSVAPQAVYTTPADLTMTLTPTDFDQTGTVDASGNVAAANTETCDLTIENTGTVDASAVYITLTNPKTGVNGIAKDLNDAIDYITVSYDSGSISGITLLKEGTYVAGGRALGELPAGSSITITINVEFLVTHGGYFPFGTTNDCKLYIWQPNSNNVDTVDFTITM